MEIAKFGVEDWLNVWEKSAKYDIAQSTISSFKLKDILDINDEDGHAFVQQMMETKFNYGWIEGSPELKEEISKLYQNVPVEDILATNGATGANYLVLYGLITPADHVIAEYPSYQQLYDVPKSLGAEVDFWRIHENQGWYPNIDELKKLIKPNTKFIILNNANNPTGTILDRKFLEQVVDIAREIDAYIVVDEVYKPLTDDVDYVSIIDLYEKGIATNSLSKTYSTPGIRLGWVVANSEVTEQLRKYRDYTMICAGVFDDALGTLILKNKEQVLNRNAKIVENNLKILTEWVENDPNVSMIYPGNVSTSFVKFNHLNPDKTEDFAIALLKETGVLIVPGNRFDLPGHARIGYCTDEQTLKTGLAKLSEFLNRYQSKKDV